MVYLDDDQVSVHLAVADDPGLPPAPWRTTEGGRVWSVSSGDLVGQQLPRAYRVSHSTLVLTPTDPAGGFRATYERI